MGFFSLSVCPPCFSDNRASLLAQKLVIQATQTVTPHTRIPYLLVLSMHSYHFHSISAISFKSSAFFSHLFPNAVFSFKWLWAVLPRSQARSLCCGWNGLRHTGDGRSPSSSSARSDQSLEAKTGFIISYVVNDRTFSSYVSITYGRFWGHLSHVLE